MAQASIEAGRPEWGVLARLKARLADAHAERREQHRALYRMVREQPAGRATGARI